MKLRLPIALVAALLATFSFSSTIQAEKLQTSLGAFRTADRVFSDVIFLGEEKESLLREEWLASLLMVSPTPFAVGDPGYYVPALGNTIDVSTIPTGATVIENAGLGFVNINSDFSSFTGQYRVTGGGTLTLTNTKTVSGGVFLSNGSTFVYDGEGTLDKALSGQGNFVKKGTGTLTFGNESTCDFDGNVTIEGGRIEIKTKTIFGSDGQTPVDAYVLSTANSSDQELITLKSGSSLRFHDQPAEGKKYSRLIVNKKVMLEDGTMILINDGFDRKDSSVIFEKGIHLVSGTSSIIFEDHKTVDIKRLTGEGIFKIETSSTLGSWFNNERTLNLFGEGDFSGEIQVNSFRVDKDLHPDTILKLKSANAAQKAVINLQGKSANEKIAFAKLIIDAETVNIAGLQGNQYSKLEASGSELRNLVVNGGGIFAGTVGANLNLHKKGNGDLIFSGASSEFNGKFTVSGGTLQVTEFGSKIGSITLENGASFIYDGAGTLNTNLSGKGNFVKRGKGTFIFGSSSTSNFDGNVVVEGGMLEVGTKSVFASDGTTPADAYVLSTANSSNTELITLKTGSSLRFHDYGSGGNSRLIVNKKIWMEDDSTIRIANGLNSPVVSVIFNKGIHLVSGTSSLVFEDHRIINVNGLTGSGTLKVETNSLGMWHNYDRFLQLFGEGGFDGEIQVNSQDVEKCPSTVVKLMDVKAAEKAVINLQGSSKDDKIAVSKLIIDSESAIIAGLKGNKYSKVENSGGNVKTLFVNGGGLFDGEIGANLNLHKQGSGELFFTGANSAFNGKFMVSGGALHIKEWGGKLGSVQLDNGATFIYEGTGSLENQILGRGNFVKKGSGTFTFGDESTSAFDGNVTIEEGRIEIKTKTLFGADGQTPVDAYVLSTANSSDLELITLKSGSSLRFHDQPAEGKKYSRLIVNKKVMLEDGTMILINDGFDRKDSSVIFEKGIHLVSGSSSIIFEDHKTVDIKRLTGDGIFKIETSSTLGSWFNNERIVNLFGEGDFSGEIQVNSFRVNNDVHPDTILKLKDSKAAQKATINLQGSRKENNIALAKLILDTDTATIAGLNGNEYSRVEGKDTLRTLEVTGGGTFKGELGSNLVLLKSGDSGVLKLEGKSASFGGNVKVSGGTLSVGTATDATKKMTLDITGGLLLLEEAAAVGNVTQVAGEFNLAHAGASADAVILNGGKMTVTANGSVASLNINASSLVEISSDGFNVRNNVIEVAGGTVRFTESGHLASGVVLNLSGGNSSVAEIAKSGEADNDFSSVLTGDGIFRISNTGATRTVYGGASDNFSGTVEVKSGVLQVGATASLKGASATISDGALLEFAGTSRQIKSLTGSTGKVSFTNPLAEISEGEVFGSYGGTLLMSQGQKVTFKRVSPTGSVLLGTTLSLEFNGSNSSVVLNNSISGTMREAIGDIRLTTDGTISLTGSNVEMFLGGSSWHYRESGTNNKLTLDAGYNGFYVDPGMDERLLQNIYLKTYNESGQAVEGVAIIGDKGKLLVDLPEELYSSPIKTQLAQSYQITADNSQEGGIVTRSEDTMLRSLTITATAGRNTELELTGNTHLGIKTGNLTIKGTGDYTIRGGSIGFVAAPLNDMKFSITQDSTGTVTISSALNNTIKLLSKSGSGDLVLSGTLQNTGGLEVVNGKLTLIGSTSVSGTKLSNHAKLVLGNGVGSYAVNYAGLEAYAGSETTVSAKATLLSDFEVKNGGTLHLLMGTEFVFNKTISSFDGATGTTHIGGGSKLTLPSGGDQNFTVDAGSSLSFNFSEALATGKTMKGAGDVNLNNTSGASLTLNKVGTSWTGFNGVLSLTGDQSITLDLGLMGQGATLNVNDGSRVNDLASSEKHVYDVTLGENATWQLTTATYEGILKLGKNGSLIVGELTAMNSNISGGSLHISGGGTLTLGGENTQDFTVVTGTTTVKGTGKTAFGKNLMLIDSASAAKAYIEKNVELDGLSVSGDNKLELGQDGILTVFGGADLSGILSGSGTLNLGGTSTLGGRLEGDMSGAEINVMESGKLTLNIVPGLANIDVNSHGELILGDAWQLPNTTITLGAGSSLSSLGGDVNVNVLQVRGEESDMPESAKTRGNIVLEKLNMLDPTARLDVVGNLTVRDGGRFSLSDKNTQAALGGAIVRADGQITISGVFGVDLNVNESFGGNEDKLSFQLFSAGGGFSASGENLRLDIDETIREFFTLNQDSFTTNGIISISRQAMICVLIDPSHISAGGIYENGYTAANSTTYLGANEKNGNDILFYDKNYTIAEGDNAYRLTSGKAWMDFHVAMTDQQLNAPTKLVIRENWMDPTNAGGILLSMRGNADNTYSGGTQIFQSKVKVDGGSSTLSGGDVYFFGTGRVEATGERSHIILNTGGDDSVQSFNFNNDFLLQQGAMLEQTSSNNILSGKMSIKGVAILKNSSDQNLTLSGTSIAGDHLRIKGSGMNSTNNTIEMSTLNGDKVNVKLNVVDVEENATLLIGNQAVTNIKSLYIAENSKVKVTSGGILSAKEIKGGTGAGTVELTEGTLRLQGDYTMTNKGVNFIVQGTEGNRSTFDLNGYYLEVNQDISQWNNFTVSGGGTMLVNTSMPNESDMNGLVTGKGTIVSIQSGNRLSGIWTIENGGTLQTKENVTLSGILNLGAGSYTDFGQNTRWEGGQINLMSGATYSGFLDATGSNISFVKGSHFQVKTEDLRKLTDGDSPALLVADNIDIENGKGFFNFSGGDGIINDAIVDSGKEKTLILGKESLTVGGLSESQWRTLGGTSVLELTAEQLAAMVGETTYRWLSFELSTEEVGESGAKINVKVTRNVNFSELAQTGNEIAIAPTLSYIGMEGGKVDSKLQGEELNELGLALTKATGDATQMLSNISLSTSSVMAGYSVQRENLRRHTMELRDRAVQERPCALRNQYESLENTLWASGQGGTYSVDGDSNAVGHTTTLWGGQLGVSRCVNDNLVLGLAFTYTSSDINLEQGLGDATSDAYYIDLYAKYHKDNWNVTGILTGGFTDMETERNMSIEGYSSRTKGSSSGNQLMGMVEVGYEFDLDGDRSNIIEPFAALTAGYSSIDGFEETGAGSAGLNVASQSDTSCSIGAGVRYVKEFSTSSDELLRGRFEVRAMILQDLTDNEVDVEARFIGANGHGFTQKSTEIGKTGFLLGTGVVLPTSANMSFFADLNGEFRSSETGCNANIGVKYNF